MKTIQLLMHDDIQLLDQVIRNDLNSNVALVREISNYIINAGGKRVRPLLTLLCGRLTGYQDGDLLHKMAAMIEYIHTATLLHDDVVDESGMRRGRKTANAVFGNSASVLVGDFLYTRAFQMMVQSNSLRLLEVMANSTNQISEGEVLQLLNIGRADITEDEYFKVIQYKTAILFEAAARVAAIINNLPAHEEDSLAKYAVNLGTAFQIVDDVLDYTGKTEIMGKNIGDDLQEGKVTLPLIYLLKHGSNQQIEQIKHAIENPHLANIDFILQAINQSNATEYCIELAKKYVDNAILELNNFSASKYKEAMIELVKFTISRVI